MSDRNPNFHNRRSIRLKGYDYSQAGLYFITLCVQNRECLFGQIVVNDVGATVGATLRGRPETDQTVKCGNAIIGNISFAMMFRRNESPDILHKIRINGTKTG